MNKISPELKARLHFHNSSLETQKQRALTDAPADAETDSHITVAVKHTGDVADLAAAGFKVTTEVGSLAFGSVDINRLTELANHAQVVRIDKVNPVQKQLDNSIPDIRADLVRTHSGDIWTGVTGAGVTVAVIDTGIDYQHHTFRKPDGKTRILKIWDQTLTAIAGENTPPDLPATHPLGIATLSYGVLYTKADIDAALSTGNPLSKVRHKDIDGHGTHVAGIAAGNGGQSGTTDAAGSCHHAFKYTGVAPEADIIIIRKRGLSDNDPKDLAGHNHTTDALRFLDEEARPKPAAIPPVARRLMAVNMSFGAFYGERDGLHENTTKYDDIAAANTTGFIMVKAAGNSANKSRHAEGTIPPNGTVDLKFLIKADDDSTRQLDIKFISKKISATVLQPPPFVGKTAEVTIATPLPAGNILNNGGNLYVNVDEDYIYIQFDPPVTGFATGKNLCGEWTVSLKNNDATPVVFNSWLNNSGTNPPHFTSPEAMINDRMTIDADSTGHDYIVVGAYASEGPFGNKIAEFSGRGPTYDARPIDQQKPDICAPGVAVTSAAIKAEDLIKECCCNCCLGFYVDNQGTSMAAPHVTGTVALMLQVKNDLTLSEARTRLKAGARKDAETEKNSHTGVATPTPNVEWGAGKLNVKAAVLPAPPAAPPVAPVVVPFMASREAPQYPPINILQERFLASPKGRYFMKIAQQHFNEIRTLINANRRVATVWHRCQGPAWLRTGFTLISAPDTRIPEAISSVKLSDAVRRLTEILLRYGSPALVNDLHFYQSDLQILRGGMSVFDLANDLDFMPNHEHAVAK
jgi:subtilisin family serine protease